MCGIETFSHTKYDFHMRNAICTDAILREDTSEWGRGVIKKLYFRYLNIKASVFVVMEANRISTMKIIFSIGPSSW